MIVFSTHSCMPIFDLQGVYNTTYYMIISTWNVMAGMGSQTLPKYNNYDLEASQYNST